MAVRLLNQHSLTHYVAFTAKTKLIESNPLLPSDSLYFLHQNRDLTCIKLRCDRVYFPNLSLKQGDKFVS